MSDELLLRSFQQLLKTHCTPADVRAFEAGRSTAKLWDALSGAGFADALVQGFSLSDVGALIVACGAHAVPLPLGETILARAALAECGRAIPEGPLELEAAGFANLSTSAAVTAALMAGAMETCLELSIAYANERKQFGKRIGTFQAVQHQLAVMAEHVAAVRLAAESAFSVFGILPDAQLAAIAKAKASESTPLVTAIAHAVHGAIGMTAGYDLQLYTRRLSRWRLRHGGELFWQKQIGKALIDSGQDVLCLVRTTGA